MPTVKTVCVGWRTDDQNPPTAFLRESAAGGAAPDAAGKAIDSFLASGMPQESGPSQNETLRGCRRHAVAISRDPKSTQSPKSWLPEACHVPDRAPFSLQTPVERSERLAGGWAVRARANPLSLGVWPFTLRFVLPTGVGLATLAEGRKAVACSRHLDPKSTQSRILPPPGSGGITNACCR